MAPSPCKKRRLTELPSDSLIDYALEQIGSGGLHPSRAVEMTSAAMCSGAAGPTVKKFSRFGSFQKMHTERDLHRWTNDFVGVEPYFLKLPLEFNVVLRFLRWHCC